MGHLRNSIGHVCSYFGRGWRWGFSPIPLAGQGEGAWLMVVGRGFFPRLWRVFLIMALALCCVLDIVRLSSTQVIHRLPINFARGKSQSIACSNTRKRQNHRCSLTLLSNDWFFLIRGHTHDLASLSSTRLCLPTASIQKLGITRHQGNWRGHNSHLTSHDEVTRRRILTSQSSGYCLSPPASILAHPHNAT
jgi:hypothetical protein